MVTLLDPGSAIAEKNRQQGRTYSSPNRPLETDTAPALSLASWPGFMVLPGTREGNAQVLLGPL